MGHWANPMSGDGEHATRLRTDLEYFTEKAFTIRPKVGPLARLKFNAAQRKLHAIIEEQKRKTGMVRIVLLKGRQMGSSTYCAARFFQETLFTPGFRTLIVAHEGAASRNLFGLVKRAYDDLPPDLKLKLAASNAEELCFEETDSGYLVTVAAQDGGAGRSATCQAAHLSEAGFWVDLPRQMASLLQTIPTLPRTSIIIESTPNGMATPFHQLWRKAEAGESEFAPVFLPWHLDENYSLPVPEGFEAAGDEKLMAELHRLTDGQLMWRRQKISQLGSIDYFNQEYPLDSTSCWLSSNHSSFIDSTDVMRARKEAVDPYGPLLVSFDPSGGGDRASMAWRRGHTIEKVVSKTAMGLMEQAHWCADIITKDKPERLYIDMGGLGMGVYERLLELGNHRQIVVGVNFGGKAVDPVPTDENGKESAGYLNRRSEMWGNMKKAFSGRFSIPDSDSLHGDLVAPGYKFSSEGKIQLESKIDIRKRGLPSPDEADAVALTFAGPGGRANPGNPNFYRPLQWPDRGCY